MLTFTITPARAGEYHLIITKNGRMIRSYHQALSLENVLSEIAKAEREES